MQMDHGSLEWLAHVVDCCPIIDNHAHNLLEFGDVKNQPFETITTEAAGPALTDTFKSLSHLRAVRQLRQLYGCDSSADWNVLLDKRSEWLQTRPEELVRKCLAGTYSILMDDGLACPGAQVYPYGWHDQFTTGPTKRIMRIETVAEQILASSSEQTVDAAASTGWSSFTTMFEKAIQEGIEDPNVVGFKSVICYRTGLALNINREECEQLATACFPQYASTAKQQKNYRIEMKAFNDYLVLHTLDILSRNTGNSSFAKPVQFHTGLGDADISLRHSNPAYMQPLIEKYPTVPFVLLHSSYPYTREAGYLAMAFKHVYLDVGEVFPMISRDGQISVLRQALELVPYSKLLWSTDGHYFPETYWLANLQFRQCLKEVLFDYVRKEDLSVPQAIELTQNILFNNSNGLYELGFSLELPGTSASAADGGQTRDASNPYDIKLWENFISLNSVDFVYVQWLDSMGTVRGRIFPSIEFEKLIRNGGRIGISKGNLGTLQDDTVTSVANTTGQIYIQPDLSSLRVVHGKDSVQAASVLCFWYGEDGERLSVCPRSVLARAIDELSANHGISTLVGFEVEVTFLRRHDSALEPYTPISKTHAWGTFGPEDMLAMPMLAEIAKGLAKTGIGVQQFHSESGTGQYEFVMPPLPALLAVDALIQARQTIQQIAESHGMRATLHPQPFGAGTGSHAHVSLSPYEGQEEHFWAGVLDHLEAICAFTLPQAVSYKRVIDDGWTGGTWVAWGTQNRETPLRKVGAGRWEVRCIDGTANMYLALGTLYRAGLLGLRNKVPMSLKDCPFNPSRMTSEQLQEYGITRKLPKGIEAALEALETYKTFVECLPKDLVEMYLVMKRVEQQKLADMEPEKRRQWLIERY